MWNKDKHVGGDKTHSIEELTEKFRYIVFAYEVLRSSEKRKLYDEQGLLNDHCFGVFN